LSQLADLFELFGREDFIFDEAEHEIFGRSSEEPAKKTPQRAALGLRAFDCRTVNIRFAARLVGDETLGFEDPQERADRGVVWRAGELGTDLVGQWPSPGARERP